MRILQRTAEKSVMKSSGNEVSPGKNVVVEFRGFLEVLPFTHEGAKPWREPVFCK
jgi:hypothetical protein